MRETTRLGWTGTAAIALALALAAPPARAQSPVGGPELLVNVTTAGDQTAAAVAALSGGGYVVVWRNAQAIGARLLDGAGVPFGGEIAVNVTPSSLTTRPSVAAVPGGGFAVAWSAPDGSGDGVYVRRFDEAGQPLTGEMRANAGVTGSQEGPRIAGGPIGFVVTWVTSSTSSIAGRILDGMATPLGVEIPVGNGQWPAVAWRGDGIVFAWADVSSAGSVWVRLFDGAGAALGPATLSNGANTPSYADFHRRQAISVAATAGGAFTVAWDQWWYWEFIPPPPSPAYARYTTQVGSIIRRYGASGQPTGGESRVNVATSGWQQDPALSVAPDGISFIAWSSIPTWEGCVGPSCPGPSPPVLPQDGSGSGVYARVFDAAGVDVGGGEFRVNVTTAGDQRVAATAIGDDGLLAVFQMTDGSGEGVFARSFVTPLVPAAIEVDPTDEPFSDGNRVLENWEAVVVAPAWRNVTGSAQVVTSTASAFTGPAGPTYSIVDGAADFGVIPHGVTRSCQEVGDCFLLGVSGVRPAAHWDAQLTESAPSPLLFAPRTRAIHVGDSFFDVPRGGPYRFVETVFHNDVMAPCAADYFCPSWAVTRETMAQFVLKALNPSFVPRPCVAGSERFVDVPASSPYCPWVEELARRGVVAGCGGGAYCPLLGVSRETMSVYLLKTREGTAYAPPACTVPVFNDVPASSPFCRWIEELARRGIVAGCGGGAYCPALGVARDQMSVFLTGTFGLLLYAP